MKIVFMGTPDFAVGALEALIKAGHEITLAVTQPDKAKGRSKTLLPPPVKECAMKHGIEVFQPVKIKTPEAVAKLREYPADVFVVAAFGQILSQEILDMPRLGCLNIHASLLPKYRGASPIQHVILDGEEKTGVTIMQMNAGLDTGDMLYRKEVVIERKDTFETLHDKLMAAGGEAITEALPLLEAGKLIPEKQKDEESCYASLITKEMGRMDFKKDAYTLELLVRGMNPWPSAFTTYKGKQLKIWEAWAENQTEGLEKEKQPDSREEEKQPGKAQTTKQPSPGTILLVAKDHFSVATGKGTLAIYSLQMEGKKRMSTHDFLLGVHLQPGEKFGE